MSDIFALHHEPWPGDGQDGYQCAGCARGMRLRSSEYEPCGLCDECVTAMATRGQILVAELAAVSKARDEACDLAEKRRQYNAFLNKHVIADAERIAALRAVGRKP